MKEEHQSKKQQEQDDQSKKENIISALSKNPLFFPILFVILVGMIIGGVYYFQLLNSRISIDKSEITVPIISLAPSAAGVLDKVYVKVGDEVGKMTRLASINGVPLYPKVHGIVTYVNDVPGQFVSPSVPVIKMIDPTQFKVVGRIDEDKGLKYIMAGQRVVFTVDAFPGKEYEGIVDSVNPTARDTDVVFSISDKRAIHQFNVNVVFDYKRYPELKSGMSAKMLVYK